MTTTPGLNAQQVRDYAARISKAVDAALAARETLAKAHQTWKADKDERLTAFIKLCGALWPCAHNLVFLAQEMQAGSVFTSTGMTTFADPKARAGGYADYVRISLGLGLHQMLESSIRSICRALAPKFQNGATGNYGPLYEYVIKNLLSTPPAYAKDYLDLLRTIRNSIHNNGTYMSIKTPPVDTSITYKGVTYDFKHGQAAEHATWDLLSTLAEDGVALLTAVMNDANVTGHTGDILDLSQ